MLGRTEPQSFPLVVWLILQTARMVKMLRTEAEALKQFGTPTPMDRDYREAADACRHPPDPA